MWRLWVRRLWDLEAVESVEAVGSRGCGVWSLLRLWDLEAVSGGCGIGRLWDWEAVGSRGCVVC